MNQTKKVVDYVTLFFIKWVLYVSTVGSIILVLKSLAEHTFGEFVLGFAGIIVQVAVIIVVDYIQSKKLKEVDTTQ